MDGFREQEHERDDLERHQDGGQDNAPAGPQAMQPMNDPVEATRRAKQAELGIVEHQLVEVAARQTAEKTEGVKIAKKAAEIAEKEAKRAEKKSTKALEAVTRASIKNAVAEKAAKEAKEAAKEARRKAEEAAERARAARQGDNAEEAEEAEEAARRAEEAVERAEEAVRRAEEAAKAARLKKEGKEGEAREAIEEAARTASASKGAQDDFNAILMKAVLDAGGMKAEPEGGEADNRKFDTLADLKNLDQGEPQGGEADTKDLKDARAAVHELRKGKLYKAVIFARILDHTTNPDGYDAEKALKDQKKAAESPENPGRFSRFFDKGIDVAGKFGKTASAVSGIKAIGDKDYGKSKMFAAISIASDVKALAGAIWGIAKKLRALIKKKVEKGAETALTVVGLVADLSTVAAKIASMTKSIGSLHNMSKINQTICSIVSDAATLFSQVLGLAGTCDALRQTVNRKKKLEEDQKGEQEKVRMITGNGDAPDDKDKKGGKEDTSEDKKDGEGDAPEGEDKKGKKDKKDKKYKKDNDLTKKVVEILSDPDIELTEDQRATLASYLARDKVIIKKEFAIANTSIGLITTVLGMISVSTKAWKDSEDLKELKDEEENGKKEEPAGQEEEKTNLERAADITAFNTNIATIASSAVMPLIVTGRDVLSKNVGKKPDLIEEGLWGALTSLGKDENKYGLRGIANGLNQEQNEQYIGKAKTAVEQYGKVEKQLDGADVDYSKLFAAENQKEFKKALVAGI